MSSQLKSIGEVVSETWELYRQRAVPILLVLLLTSVLVIGVVCIFGVLLALGLGGAEVLSSHLEPGRISPLALILALSAFLIIFPLIFWSQAATLAVTVNNNLGIMEALKAGWKYLVPLGWVGTFYMGIVMTGTMLFLVPGVFLGLSMSLCFYALIDDDRRGMDALLASQHYVRGHWWNTFGKFFLVWLISMGVSLVPVIGQLLSFVFTPFLLLYMVIVYRDLKEAAGEVDLHSGPRRLWTLMATAGILLPLLGLVGAMVTLGPQLPDLIRQVQEGKLPELQLSQPHKVQQKPGRVGSVSAPVVRRLSSVDGTLVWRDPAGDTGNPLLDITEVAAQKSGKQLVLSVATARSLAEYFAAGDPGTFDPLISFYLDTDVNRETGVDPLAGAGRSGYDVILDVLLEPGSNLTASEMVQVSMYRQEGQQRKSLGTLDTAEVTVSGKRITIRVPSALVHAEGGEALRICYREAGQQQGSGLAKDQLLPLKIRKE